jgi:opacity protein-like surface antigen
MIQKFMKKKNIILFLSLITSTPLLAASPYIEGQINYTQVDNVDTVTYSGSGSGVTWTNAKLTNKYDSDTSLGFEVGAKELFNNNLRIGFSYGKSKIKLKSTTLSGSVTDGTTTLTGTSSFSREDVASVGVSFDNDVKSYSMNFYYDFNNSNGIVPFVGAGIGQVDIQNAKDKEMSKSIYIGGRYSINQNTYLGAKGTYTIVDGPQDKLGLSYDDITIKSVSLIIGYQF